MKNPYHTPLIPIPCHIPYHLTSYHIIRGVWGPFTKYEKYFYRLQYLFVGLHLLWTGSSDFCCHWATSGGYRVIVILWKSAELAFCRSDGNILWWRVYWYVGLCGENQGSRMHHLRPGATANGFVQGMSVSICSISVTYHAIHLEKGEREPGWRWRHRGLRRRTQGEKRRS